MRRHASEDVYGVQVAGGWSDQMHRLGHVVSGLGVQADFVDLNCGCPIDAMCNRGQVTPLLAPF